MRILHVTDLHFRKPWFHWLNQQARTVDVVVSSGDWVNARANGLHDQAKWVRNWIGHFPGRLAGCTGNHDWWISAEDVRDVYAEGGWLQMSNRPRALLDRSGDILGTRFHCRPWNSDLADTFVGPDVIVTHAPPAAYPIGASRGSTREDFRGQDALDAASSLTAGGLLFCGHVHQPRRWCCKIVDAWCFNAGVDDSSDIPNHIIVDTVAKTAVAWQWGKQLSQELH